MKTIFISLLIFSVRAIAQEALAKTQHLMTTSSEREAALKQDPAAADADKRARDLMGSKENTEEFYKISSEIFKDQTEKAGGDPAKLKEQMSEAKSNPEEFGNSLPESELSKIRNLASKIEEKQAGALHTNQK
jgi:hypothetical protein